MTARLLTFLRWLWTWPAEDAPPSVVRFPGGMFVPEDWPAENAILDLPYFCAAMSPEDMDRALAECRWAEAERDADARENQ